MFELGIIPIIYLVVVILSIVGAVVLFVLLVRLMLAATRARDAETVERKLRTDLMIAERGDPLDP